MLRLLITTGLILMAVGFGMAGWQFLQGHTATGAVGTVGYAETRGATQGWLTSVTGAPVTRADSDAYLEQDRFVPSRRVTLTRTAQLADLLAPDEKLPEVPYLQVLADIRAFTIAQELCPALTDRVAQTCAVNLARVIEGSVDSLRGTADFRFELVFRLKTGEEEAPDIGRNVFGERVVELEITPELAAAPETALAALVDAATEACVGAGQLCRLMEIDLDLASAEPAAVGRARIGWLAPMPAGMVLVPPLGAGSGN